MRAMTLAPLWSAPQPIPLHALAAVAALLIGLMQIILPKGTRRHVVQGWLWVALMAFVALSSFLIVARMMPLGRFGPIHALSAFTLLSLAGGVLAIRRRRDVRLHGATMIYLFLGALVVAGAGAFMPDRIMHRVVAGPSLAPPPGGS